MESLCCSASEARWAWVWRWSWTKRCSTFLPRDLCRSSRLYHARRDGAGVHAAVSLLTGLLFGLVPALQSTRPQLAATLKDQAGGADGRRSVLLRKGLVVAQVALSLLLLIGAGLFLQSLQNLKELNPGFDTTNLVSFAVDPTLTGKPIKPGRLTITAA